MHSDTDELTRWTARCLPPPDEPTVFADDLQCGVYVFQTTNRPDSCKVGFSSKLTRRFDEHCVHDARHTASYAVTVSVHADYHDLGTGLSRETVMRDVCQLARGLESYVLSATRAHHDPEMKEEWRLFDVTTLADDLEEYALERNACNPFVMYTVLRNWRPPCDVVGRTRVEEGVGVDPPEDPVPVLDTSRTLRPYQEEALDEALTHYHSDDANANKAQLVWACGLGKTLFAVRLMHRLGADHVLVVTPYSHLVDQFAATVVSERTYSGGLASPLVHKCVLVRGRRCTVQGTVPPTTFDTCALPQWLADHRHTVVVSTYSSVHRLVALGTPFDLVVCDEAHHLCGTTGPVGDATARRENANGNADDTDADATDADADADTDAATGTVGVYEAALAVPTRRTLFLTATPIDVTDPATQQRDAKRWMDDPTVFGKRLTERSLAWAIEYKFVSDFEVRALEMSSEHLERMFVALPALRAVFERLHATRDDHDLTRSQRLFCAAWAVVKALRSGECRRQIVYTNNHRNGEWVTKCAQDIVAALDREEGGATVTAPSVDVWYADSRTSATERKQTLERFQDPMRPPSMLVNVYLFSEGTDVPCADGVTLAEPMGSYVRGTQSLTRCMRLDPDNPDKRALVLLPVFVSGPATVGLHETTYAEVGHLLDRFRDADRECFVGKTTVSAGGDATTGGPNTPPPPTDTLDDATTVNAEATRELQFHIMQRYSSGLSLGALYTYLRGQGVHDATQYAIHRDERGDDLRERLPVDVHESHPGFGWVHTEREHSHYATGDECRAAIRRLRRNRAQARTLDACRNNAARNRTCHQWDTRVPNVADGALHRYYGGKDAPREEAGYYA
jgi:superfamily II DNA or RNA helicase